MADWFSSLFGGGAAPVASSTDLAGNTATSGGGFPSWMPFQQNSFSNPGSMNMALFNAGMTALDPRAGMSDIAGAVMKGQTFDKQNAKDLAMKRAMSTVPRDASGNIDSTKIVPHLFQSGAFTEPAQLLSAAAHLETVRQNQEEKLHRNRVFDAGRSDSNRDYGLRREQFDEAKRQHDASISRQGLPDLMERDGAGGVRWMKGGQELMQQKQQLTKEPPKLDHGDIKEMSKEGGILSETNFLKSTFKDNYGGYVFGALGKGVNELNKAVPDWLANEGGKERAAWWQRNAAKDNIVRNSLFGSALSAQESANYESAVIHPGMSPESIRRNLAVQDELIRTGVMRRATSMMQQGYKPQAVLSAFGLTAQDFVSGGGGGGQQQQQQQRIRLDANGNIVQ